MKVASAIGSVIGWLLSYAEMVGFGHSHAVAALAATAAVGGFGVLVGLVVWLDRTGRIG